MVLRREDKITSGWETVKTEVLAPSNKCVSHHYCGE